MTFRMSPKAVIEEELMEAASFYSNFQADVQKAIDLLRKNENLDHLNDQTRADVTTHLLAALSSCNLNDLGGANKHINAGLQRMHMQEVADLKDDQPRTDALIKLSVMLHKAVEKEKRLKLIIKSIQAGEVDLNKAFGEVPTT